MTATQVKKGQLITATTTEVAYTLDGAHRQYEDVVLTWVSGTFKYTVAPITDSPAIDANAASISSGNYIAGMDTSNSSLRIAGGTGTLIISW